LSVKTGCLFWQKRICLVCKKFGQAFNQIILPKFYANHIHAKIAAEIDAALQDHSAKTELLKTVIEPLQKIRDENLKESRMKTAATKVDFFTVVRGED